MPDGPFFRTSCNPALRKRFHISVGADAPVRPPTIAPLASPVIARAHRARGNPFLFGFVQGYYGCPCCGAQNFCAALRLTLKILTAATRSLRFLCHRQRSVRSPHRPALPYPPVKLPVIANQLPMSLVWQSATPVPLAPLPKGGWHGKAVTGGSFPRTHGRAHGPCPTK